MRQGCGGSAGAGLRRCLSSQGTSHARPCPLSVDAVGSDALRRREHVFGALAYSRVSLYYKDRDCGPGSTAGEKPSMASVSLCNLVPCLLRVDVNVPEHSTQHTAHICARRTMATSHADGVCADEPSFLAGRREASVELPEPPQISELDTLRGPCPCGRLRQWPVSRCSSAPAARLYDVYAVLCYQTVTPTGVVSAHLTPCSDAFF